MVSLRWLCWYEVFNHKTESAEVFGGLEWREVMNVLVIWYAITAGWFLRGSCISDCQLLSCSTNRNVVGTICGEGRDF